MNDEQIKATRSFRLLSEKPMLVLVNASDDDEDLDRFAAASTPETRILGASRVGIGAGADGSGRPG